MALLSKSTLSTNSIIYNYLRGRYFELTSLTSLITRNKHQPTLIVSKQPLTEYYVYPGYSLICNFVNMRIVLRVYNIVVQHSKLAGLYIYPFRKFFNMFFIKCLQALNKWVGLLTFYGVWVYLCLNNFNLPVWCWGYMCLIYILVSS